MAAHTPRVSIGMPVYNGERYLATAIDSILAQSFADFELIIADNASTDGTQQICEDYAARDVRIIYLRNSVNVGAAKNFNRVFHEARGAYFKWAAHDDVLEVDFLRRCVEVLDRDAGVVLAYPQIGLIDDHGADLGPYPYNGMHRADARSPHRRFSDIVVPNHWCIQVFGLFRTEALRDTPLIGNYFSSDKVLLSWVALKGRFVEIPELLFRSRRHLKQSVAQYTRLQYMAWYDPQHRANITLPCWMEYLNYFTVVRQAKIGWYQKLLCLWALVVFLFFANRTRLLIKDVLIAGALIVSRSVLRRSITGSLSRT